MAFENEKKQAIDKMRSGDKSRKGSVDARISRLVDAINADDDYYTTSSCSGRIIILTYPGSRKDVKWLYVTHETADASEIIEKLSNIPTDQVWFKQESFILHVAARDMKSAQKLIALCKSHGLKRAGIYSVSKKITIEIIYHLGFETPISKEGKLIVPTDFISELTSIANLNMKSNWDKIDEITRSLGSIGK